METKQDYPKVEQDFTAFPNSYEEYRDLRTQYMSEIKIMRENKNIFYWNFNRAGYKQPLPKPGMWFYCDGGIFDFSFGFVVDVKHYYVRDTYKNGKPKKSYTLRHFMLCCGSNGNLKTVEFKLSEDGTMVSIPFWIYLKPNSELELPSAQLERTKEEETRKEEQRLSQKMEITVGLWESMLKKISSLESHINQLEQDLNDNYSRIPNPLEE